MEHEIYEVEKTTELVQLMGREKLDFIILNEDVMPNDSVACLGFVRKISVNSKVMLIGHYVLKDCPHTSFILNSNSKKEVLDKFQEFIFAPEPQSHSGEDNSVLSDREVEVLKEVALGFSNKEIADKLFISINTVITHRKNITEKLGIKTIAGLTVYAMMNNLINPDEVINH